MEKTIKNILFGSIAFTTGALLYSFNRKKRIERQILEQEQELERKYIDLSDQLSKIKDENEELSSELEEVKTKKYA